MKPILLTAIAIILLAQAGMGQAKQVKHPKQNRQLHIKCHYFYDENGYDGTFDGKPLLDSHHNIVLQLPKMYSMVKVGDTIAVTYFTIAHKWDIDTSKNETCYRCNSPYFEEYKVIVTKKF